MQGLIPQLTKNLPLILGGLGILIAALVGSLIFLVRSSQKKQSASKILAGALKQKSVLQKQYQAYGQKASAEAAAVAEAAPAEEPGGNGLWSRVTGYAGFHKGRLKASFRETLKLLREKIPGRDYRYRVPWFVAIGQSGAGKTTLMDNVGLPKPFGSVEGDPFVLRNSCTWWLYSNGLVLDVDGSMILSADGRTSDDGTWSSFLSLLRRNRPERPVDGFIIMIPAGDMIGSSKLSNEELRHKADQLYQKIWQAQKALGMTFPVYIFVTKCDQITGFRSYVSELPKPLQNDMFGWSNPYSIHSAFIPEWVDEAFANLNSTIYRTQIEIFAESEVVEDSDGIFMFPTEFQTLIEPLRIYLNHLFKESAYHESFMFRGIYFSGDAELDAPVQTLIGGSYVPSAARTTRPKPVFLKHVFERKIFPEFRIARPVFRSVLARNRWALAGQAACIVFLVVGGLGLLYSRSALRADVAAFRPVLLDVEKDLTQIRDVETSAQQQLTSAQVQQRLQGVDPTKILAGMEQINSGTMKSFWLPSSWVSDLDARTDQVLNTTFNKIVLGSIHLNLDQRIQQLLEIEPPPPSADTTFRAMNVVGSAEFQTLRRFLDRTAEIEEYTLLYNFEATPDSGDLPTLGKLVKYIYGVELPQSFYEHSDFYFRALKSTRQELIDIEDLRRQVTAKTQELGQRFFDSLVDRQIPVAQLNEIQMELDALSREPTRADSDPEPYRVLMRTIDELVLIFARPELAWLGKPTFDPGPEWGQLLDLAQKSTLIGLEGRMKLEDMATVNFDLIRSTLLSYQSSLTGPVLQLVDAGFKPADAVTSLRKGLEDFLNQRFMAASSGRGIRTVVPPGSRFTWDVAVLQQALPLVEPYNEFAVGGLVSFRPELQRRLRVMALNRLEANMVAVISAAERTESAILPNASLEQDVENETKQLVDVTKPLSDLLSAFDRLGLTDSYRDLSAATLSSAYLHLRAVDQLFNQKSPYAFNDAALARWDGVEPLVPFLFGVKDDKELLPYLDAQRETLKSIKENADPALAIISSQRTSRPSAADAQLLAKWQGIALEIEKYDNKNPSGSLTALETFVTTVLPTLTVDNYTEKITPQDAAAQSAEFFLAKRNNLRRAVYDRFDAVFTARALQQYREIESYFNLRLAGRFPFALGVAGGGEADPVSLRAFFKLFDTYNKNIVKYLDRSAGRSAAGSRVLQFIDQAAAVRTVLTPFLDDPKAVVPIFDFEVEFRVNRRNEAGGSNLIEWILEVADRRITARDTLRQGRWVSGDPVRISFRWAKDGNVAPSPDSLEGILFEDKQVTFEETGRWALLKMLKNHASAPMDFEQLVDPTPQTLKFLIPTLQSGSVLGQAKVFIRLTPLTADKKEPITFPVFPDRAPPIDRT